MVATEGTTMRLRDTRQVVVVVALLCVACSASPGDKSAPGNDASRPVGTGQGTTSVPPSTRPSAVVPNKPPANAGVVRRATTLLTEVGLTSVRDTDGDDRHMQNASLSGTWRGNPVIAHVVPASFASTTLRVASASVVDGTKVEVVAPEDSGLRPARFTLGSDVWQVSVTLPNGVRSNQRQTRTLVRAILMAA